MWSSYWLITNFQRCNLSSLERKNNYIPQLMSMWSTLGFKFIRECKIGLIGGQNDADAANTVHAAADNDIQTSFQSWVLLLNINLLVPKTMINLSANLPW